MTSTFSSLRKLLVARDIKEKMQILILSSYVEQSHYVSCVFSSDTSAQPNSRDQLMVMLREPEDQIKSFWGAHTSYRLYV